jgi:hypothetical protein
MTCQKIISIFTVLLGLLPANLLFSQTNPDPAATENDPVVDQYNNPVVDSQGKRINFSKEFLQQHSLTVASREVVPLNSQPPVQFTDPALTITGDPLLNLRKRFGIFGSSIGRSGIVVGDVDINGRMDIIIGGSTGTYNRNDFWQLLEFDPATSSYIQKWQSRFYQSPISRIALFDLDNDGYPSIFICQKNGNIEIIDPQTMETVHTIVTNADSINQIFFTDADNDTFPEIVFISDQALYLYDPVSLTLKYQLPYGARDFAIGNVDGDPANELVLTSGHVLEFNGITTKVEWLYNDGFGVRIKLADLDNDGMEEIICAASWHRVTAFDADLTSPKWEFATDHDIGALLVQDTDNDGQPEVLYGDGQWGDLHCLDGQTGSNELWYIDNPEHGFTDIAVADFDQDGALEVAWGAGATSSGADYLYIHDIDSQAKEWQSLQEFGPFEAMDIGDLDSDGDLELVFSSAPDYPENGSIYVYDAATLTLEVQSQGDVLGTQNDELHALKIADVDDDGVNEIVLVGSSIWKATVYIIDGQTLTMEQEYTFDSGSIIHSLAVADVDNDGQTEIIIGSGRESTGADGVYVYVLNGATGAVEWQSISLGDYWSEIYSIQVADIDHDNVPEIVATNDRISVFDGISHQMWQTGGTDSYTALNLVDLDGDSIPEIVAGTENGSVVVIDGQSQLREAVFPVSTGKIYSLALLDIQLENQADPDIIFSSNGMAQVYDVNQKAVVWQSEYAGDKAGLANALLTYRLNGGTTTEIALGTKYNVSLFTRDTVPLTSCFADTDQDGYGSTSSKADNGDGVCLTVDEESTLDTDCNDNDPTINPNAEEIFGDGIDQDCDGEELCYQDSDGDGYGSSLTVLDSGDTGCLTADGESSVKGDCNDSNAGIHPDAAEIIGDGIDQNCNSTELCYVDADNDRYRPDCYSILISQDSDCYDSGEAYFTDPTGDCNDNDYRVSPSASETVGDGIDQNCDGIELCYQNLDHDPYGSAFLIADNGDLQCLPTDGEAVTDGDCNDQDATIYPDTAEIIGDGVDQNCDTWELCFADLDEDGFRSDPLIAVYSVDMDCSDPGEADPSTPTGDCNDGNPDIHPGATEIIADGIDQDCTGNDICYLDGDNDGHRPDAVSTIPDNGNLTCTDYGEAEANDPIDDCNDNDPSVYPGAVEICDNKDNNCNALIDENGVCSADNTDSFWFLVLPAILNGSNPAR